MFYLCSIGSNLDPALHVSHNPLCKVADRPLDIDILACGERDDFAEAGVDAYLGDLLAEMYQGGSVDSGKVTLGLPGSKVFAKQRIGQAPIHLCQQDEALLPGNGHPGPPSRHAAIRHP